MDAERLQRTRTAMGKAGLDTLVLKLSENVVMLSGYWPMNGFSYLIFPLDKDPILIAPVPEEYLANEGWVKDIRAFKWGLVDSGNPFESIARLLKQASLELKLTNKSVGYEASFEFIATPYVAA